MLAPPSFMLTTPSFMLTVAFAFPAAYEWASRLVRPDTLIHDDQCHFETWVKLRNPDAYKDIKYWVVDRWQRPNHKCRKCKYTRREEERLAGCRPPFYG